MAYRLNSKDLVLIDEIRGAAQALTERINDMQGKWDDATERWQESERGQV